MRLFKPSANSFSNWRTPCLVHPASSRRPSAFADYSPAEAERAVKQAREVCCILHTAPRTSHAGKERHANGNLPIQTISIGRETLGENSRARTDRRSSPRRPRLRVGRDRSLPGTSPPTVCVGRRHERAEGRRRHAVPHGSHAQARRSLHGDRSRDQSVRGSRSRRRSVAGAFGSLVYQTATAATRDGAFDDGRLGRLDGSFNYSQRPKERHTHERTQD